jgi:hypothetical protein
MCSATRSKVDAWLSSPSETILTALVSNAKTSRTNLYQRTPQIKGRDTIKTTIGLAGCLLLWLAIFLGKTIYPHAKSFYMGMREAETGWPERSREHERLQRFSARISPWVAKANGKILFVYGEEPEVGKIIHYLAATKYLLYPARMFTHATGISTAISHIALYQTKQEAFHSFPFCRKVEEKNYLCQVRPAKKPLRAYEVRIQYKPPHLTITARATEPEQSDPAFLIFSLKTRSPMESGFNALLVRQATINSPRGEMSSYRMQVTIPVLPLNVDPFHLLVVDKSGWLSVSPEHALVPTPSQMGVEAKDFRGSQEE